MGYQPGEVKRRVEEELTARFEGVDVEVGSARLRPFLGGVNVSDVNVFGLHLNLLDPMQKYYFIFGFIVLAMAALSRILSSSFGGVIEAVRENEARARACGFDIERTTLLSFVLSAAFCGLAGALSAIHLLGVAWRYPRAECSWLL